MWVRDDVDPAQAVKTLAHELAHVMLHVAGGAVAGCRGVIEVEAESVAHLVLGVHHVDTGSYTFPYVAAWAHPIATAEQVPMSEIVARTGARVMRAADQIITATQTAATVIHPGPARAGCEPGDLGGDRPGAPTSTTRPTAFDGRPRRAARGGGRQSRLLPPPGRILMGADYLEHRGLDEVIESRQLGYAPAGWTALTDHLRSLGYTDDHIEAAGMATRARTGRLIDRMRDRLVIPLRDVDGNVVGFTGRTRPGQVDTDIPKYLNTPTTAIFHKGQVLYGLWENRARTDHGTPVVCEGPLDAIAVDLPAGQQRLDVFGVAASGTAFTPEHAQLLESRIQHGRPICLAFDADPAGVKATERTWRLITDAGWRHVTALELPDGKDPAALYSRNPTGLLGLITTARPAGLVIAERQIASADLAGNVAKEIAAFRDLFPLATRLPPEDRAGYLRMLTDTLRIDRSIASMLIAETHVLMDRSRPAPHRLTRPAQVRVEGPSRSFPDQRGGATTGLAPSAGRPDRRHRPGPAQPSARRRTCGPVAAAEMTRRTIATSDDHKRPVTVRVPVWRRNRGSTRTRFVMPGSGGIDTKSAGPEDRQRRGRAGVQMGARRPKPPTQKPSES